MSKYKDMSIEELYKNKAKTKKIRNTTLKLFIILGAITIPLVLLIKILTWLMIIPIIFGVSSMVCGFASIFKKIDEDEINQQIQIIEEHRNLYEFHYSQDMDKFLEKNNESMVENAKKSNEEFTYLDKTHKDNQDYNI